jgi:hypothetical protein
MALACMAAIKVSNACRASGPSPMNVSRRGSEYFVQGSSRMRFLHTEADAVRTPASSSGARSRARWRVR